MRTSLFFDIETVVDPDLAREVLGEPGISDDDALRRVAPPHSEGEPHGFPKPLYHRVIAISVALVGKDGVAEHLKPLGTETTDERALLGEFLTGLKAHVSDRLVTFNGHSFDIPVVVHRSLLHTLSPGPLLQRAYRYRFGEDHIDMMDFLSNYRAFGSLSQHEMAAMLGVPGKIGKSGADVGSLWSRGQIGELRAYGTCDVATLALAFARLGPHAGWCRPEEATALEASVASKIADLEAGGDALYSAFLQALQARREAAGAGPSTA